MAYSTIDKASSYVSNFIYDGDGAARSFTDPGFLVDMNWTKRRDTTGNHVLSSSVSGTGKNMYPDLSDAEATDAQGITSYDANGYSTGTSSNWNGTGGTYVSYNWKGGTTTGVDFSAGDITPSSYSINTTAGFGVYKFAGTNAAATMAHGLGATPDMIIIKESSESSGWAMYHIAVGNTKALVLNTTAAADTSTLYWNDTSPTSTLFSMSTYTNTTATSIMAYVFAGKKGFSRFGKFTGTGVNPGPFIYTGFKPHFFLAKMITDAGYSATLRGDAINTYGNISGKHIIPDTNAAAGDGKNINILSNGVQVVTTDGGVNLSAKQYIYCAWGQTTSASNNVIATAK